MRKVLALLVVFAVLGAARGESPSAAAGILILGDSNSEGPFGGTLYDTLRAVHDPVSGQLLNVTIFAKCGAGAKDWTERDYANIDCGAWSCGAGLSLRDCRHFRDGDIPPLPDLYAELRSGRRVTIAALGLNMIIGNRREKLRDATKLIAAIHAQHSAGRVWSAAARRPFRRSGRLRQLHRRSEAHGGEERLPLHRQR